jgi:hypothetical protein
MKYSRLSAVSWMSQAWPVAYAACSAIAHQAAEFVSRPYWLPGVHSHPIGSPVSGLVVSQACHPSLSSATSFLRIVFLNSRGVPCHVGVIMDL